MAPVAPVPHTNHVTYPSPPCYRGESDISAHVSHVPCDDLCAMIDMSGASASTFSWDVIFQDWNFFFKQKNISDKICLFLKEITPHTIRFPYAVSKVIIITHSSSNWKFIISPSFVPFDYLSTFILKYFLIAI